MSIIYEALKKTQHNREVKRNPARKAAYRSTFSMRDYIRDMEWMDVGLAGVIGFLMVISATTYTVHFARKISHHHQIVASAAHPATVVPAALNVKQHAPVIEANAPTSSDNTDLVLNGVLLSDEEKLALINNKTFHVGDMVGGMRIVSIDFNSVKLANGGQLMTLRTAS